MASHGAVSTAIGGYTDAVMIDEDAVAAISGATIRYTSLHTGQQFSQMHTQPVVAGNGASPFITASAVVATNLVKRVAVASRGLYTPLVTVYDVSAYPQRSVAQVSLSPNEPGGLPLQFDAVALSRSGGRLAAIGCAPDNALFLWTTRTGVRLPTASPVKLPGRATRVSFCPGDMSKLAVSGPGLLRFIHIDKHKEVYDVRLVQPSSAGAGAGSGASKYTFASSMAPEAAVVLATEESKTDLDELTSAAVAELMRPVKVGASETVARDADVRTPAQWWVAHAWVAPHALAAANAAGDVVVFNVDTGGVIASTRLCASSSSPVVATSLAGMRDVVIAGCSDGAVRYLAVPSMAVIRHVVLEQPTVTLPLQDTVVTAVVPGSGSGSGLSEADPAALLASGAPDGVKFAPAVTSVSLSPSFGLLAAATAAGTLHVFPAVTSLTPSAAAAAGNGEAAPGAAAAASSDASATKDGDATSGGRPRGSSGSPPPLRRGASASMGGASDNPPAPQRRMGRSGSVVAGAGSGSGANTGAAAAAGSSASSGGATMTRGRSGSTLMRANSASRLLNALHGGAAGPTDALSLLKMTYAEAGAGGWAGTAFPLPAPGQPGPVAERSPALLDGHGAGGVVGLGTLASFARVNRNDNPGGFLGPHPSWSQGIAAAQGGSGSDGAAAPAPAGEGAATGTTPAPPAPEPDTSATGGRTLSITVEVPDRGADGTKASSIPFIISAGADGTLRVWATGAPPSYPELWAAGGGRGGAGTLGAGLDASPLRGGSGRPGSSGTSSSGMSPPPPVAAAGRERSLSNLGNLGSRGNRASVSMRGASTAFSASIGVSAGSAAGAPGLHTPPGAVMAACGGGLPSSHRRLMATAVFATEVVDWIEPEPASPAHTPSSSSAVVDPFLAAVQHFHEDRARLVARMSQVQRAAIMRGGEGIEAGGATSRMGGRMSSMVGGLASTTSRATRLGRMTSTVSTRSNGTDAGFEGGEGSGTPGVLSPAHSLSPTRRQESMLRSPSLQRNRSSKMNSVALQALASSPISASQFKTRGLSSITGAAGFGAGGAGGAGGEGGSGSAAAGGRGEGFPGLDQGFAELMLRYLRAPEVAAGLIDPINNLIRVALPWPRHLVPRGAGHPLAHGGGHAATKHALAAAAGKVPVMRLRALRITALAAHASLPVLAVGTSDGAVTVLMLCDDPGAMPAAHDPAAVVEACRPRLNDAAARDTVAHALRAGVPKLRASAAGATYSFASWVGGGGGHRVSRIDAAVTAAAEAAAPATASITAGLGLGSSHPRQLVLRTLHRDVLHPGAEVTALAFVDTAAGIPLLASVGAASTPTGANSVVVTDLRKVVVRAKAGAEASTLASPGAAAPPSLSLVPAGGEVHPPSTAGGSTAPAAGGSNDPRLLLSAAPLAVTAAVAFAKLPEGSARRPTAAAWARDFDYTPTLFLGTASGHLLSVTLGATFTDAATLAAAPADVSASLRIRTRLPLPVTSLAASAAVRPAVDLVSSGLVSGMEGVGPRGDGFLLLALAGEKGVGVLPYDPLHMGVAPLPPALRDYDAMVLETADSPLGSLLMLLPGQTQPATAVAIAPSSPAPGACLAAAGGVDGSTVTWHLALSVDATPQNGQPGAPLVPVPKIDVRSTVPHATLAGSPITALVGGGATTAFLAASGGGRRSEVATITVPGEQAASRPSTAATAMAAAVSRIGTSWVQGAAAAIASDEFALLTAPLPVRPFNAAGCVELRAGPPSTSTSATGGGVHLFPAPVSLAERLHAAFVATFAAADASRREALLKEVAVFRQELQRLLDMNAAAPPDEQLSRVEFVVDEEGYRKRVASHEAAADARRRLYKAQCAALDAAIARVKEAFVEPMAVLPAELRSLLITVNASGAIVAPPTDPKEKEAAAAAAASANPLGVPNFPIKKRSKREAALLARIAYLRRVEQADVAAHEGAEAGGTWSGLATFVPADIDWMYGAGLLVHGLDPVKQLEAVLARTGGMTVTTAAPAEGEGAGATPAALGSSAAAVEIDPSTWVSPDGAVLWEGEAVLGLLYHPAAVRTPPQKRAQIALLGELIRTVQLNFNAAFDKLLQEKCDVLEAVHTRNTRIVEILSDLGSAVTHVSPLGTASHPPGSLVGGARKARAKSAGRAAGGGKGGAAAAARFLARPLGGVAPRTVRPGVGPVTDERGQMVVIDPSLHANEVPAALMTVTDAEVGLSAYVSEEDKRRAAEEEERRRKEAEATRDDAPQRALEDMMGGTLEARDELEALQAAIEGMRAPWQTEIGEQDWTTDQRTIWAAMQAKVAALEEEKAKRRHALQGELARLTAEVRDALTGFDEKLVALNRTRERLAQWIAGYETYIARLAVGVLAREETAATDRRLEALWCALLPLEEEAVAAHDAFKSLHDSEAARLDALRERDRGLERGFRDALKEAVAAAAENDPSIDVGAAADAEVLKGCLAAFRKRFALPPPPAKEDDGGAVASPRSVTLPGGMPEALGSPGSMASLPGAGDSFALNSTSLESSPSMVSPGASGVLASHGSVRDAVGAQASVAGGGRSAATALDPFFEADVSHFGTQRQLGNLQAAAAAASAASADASSASAPPPEAALAAALAVAQVAAESDPDDEAAVSTLRQAEAAFSLRPLTKADLPEGFVSLPDAQPAAWAQTMLLRREKLLSEIEVAAKAREVGEMRAWLATLAGKYTRIKGLVDLVDARRDALASAQELDTNETTMLLRLRQGHLETRAAVPDAGAILADPSIASSLTPSSVSHTAPSMYNYAGVLAAAPSTATPADPYADAIADSDTLLTPSHVLESINAGIRAAGDKQVAVLDERRLFRRDLLQLQWETRYLRAQSSDAADTLRDFQLMRAAGTVGDWLKGVNVAARARSDADRAEARTAYLTGAHAKARDKLTSELAKAREAIKSKQAEVAALADKRRDLQGAVELREGIWRTRESLAHGSTTAGPGAVGGGGGGGGGIAAVGSHSTSKRWEFDATALAGASTLSSAVLDKVQTVATRAHLNSIAIAQRKELDALRAEVVKLRAKNFVSFAGHQPGLY